MLWSTSHKSCVLQHGSGYVDVSVRAVDATDAQNLTSTWQTIANQVLVSDTFMTTFNALLTNVGTVLGQLGHGICAEQARKCRGGGE